MTGSLKFVTIGGTTTPPTRFTMTIIGPPKSGKTTFGANVVHSINKRNPKDPAFLVDLEDGAAYVPFEVLAVKPTDWQQIKDLTTYRGPAIVIDTIDYAYDLLVSYALKKFGVSALGEAAYGAGWAFVREELMNFLDLLRRNYNIVILLAHSRVGESGDMPRIDIPGKTGRSIIAWSDVVGFMSVREENGRYDHVISFSPGVGESGSRIPQLQGKVLTADWKVIRAHLLGSDRDQPEQSEGQT